MTGVHYEGHRDHGRAVVTKHVDDNDPEPLDSRLDLRRHSPDGLEWGYLGSGPAQLALALTSDVLGDEHGEAIYQKFKMGVIGQVPQEGFRITAEAVEAWAAELERTSQVPKLPWPGIQFWPREVLPPEELEEPPPPAEEDRGRDDQPEIPW
jgi:hypothetical protein